MLGTEYQILRKYASGGVVEEEDRSVLSDCAKVGYISFGYSIARGRETAKLTDMGLAQIEMEEIKRKPLKAFLNAWRDNIRFP